MKCAHVEQAQPSHSRSPTQAQPSHTQAQTSTNKHKQAQASHSHTHKYTYHIILSMGGTHHVILFSLSLNYCILSLHTIIALPISLTLCVYFTPHSTRWHVFCMVAPLVSTFNPIGRSIIVPFAPWKQCSPKKKLLHPSSTHLLH